LKKHQALLRWNKKPRPIPTSGVIWRTAIYYRNTECITAAELLTGKNLNRFFLKQAASPEATPAKYLLKQICRKNGEGIFEPVQ